MKKLSYLLGLMLIAGMVFTSCKKDDDEPKDETPTLHFKGGEFAPGIDYVSGNVTLPVDTTFIVGITAQSNSGKDLTNFEVTSKFENENPVIYDSTFSESTFDADLQFPTNANVGEEVWIFTMEDKNGNKKQLSFIVTTEEPFTPLGVPIALTWQRVGAAAGTGLDTFGLKWTLNAKETHAQIKKADGGAEKFVLLNPEEWTSIETVEDLAAVVEAGADMEVYEGISTTTGNTYDVVLATKFDNEYFIIHLVEATVEVLVSGTTITITGEYKK